jgi:hypothetical protein
MPARTEPQKVEMSLKNANGALGRKSLIEGRAKAGLNSTCESSDVGGHSRTISNRIMGLENDFIAQCMIL